MTDKVIHYEVLANQIAGFLFGYLVTTYLIVYLIENKIFDVHVIGLVTASIFAVYSYLRMYGIRYLFKRFGHK